MAARGVVVSYESVRQWCLKFGEEYAQKLRKKEGNLERILAPKVGLNEI